MGIVGFGDQEASERLDLRGTREIRRWGRGRRGETLRTGAAAPERTVGPDGFRASSTASNLYCRWTFSSEDVAGSSVVGHGHRNSVSDVVEIEAQSSPCFGCGSANTPDCLGL